MIDSYINIDKSHKSFNKAFVNLGLNKLALKNITNSNQINLVVTSLAKYGETKKNLSDFESTNKSFPTLIIVDDKDCFWEEGKSVLFDDTYTHEVINNTNEVRIALLLDVKREISGFLKYYDMFVFKLIKSLVVLNNTFSKSKLK